MHGAAPRGAEAVPHERGVGGGTRVSRAAGEEPDGGVGHRAHDDEGERAAREPEDAERVRKRHDARAADGGRQVQGRDGVRHPDVARRRRLDRRVVRVRVVRVIVSQLRGKRVRFGRGVHERGVAAALLVAPGARHPARRSREGRRARETAQGEVVGRGGSHPRGAARAHGESEYSPRAASRSTDGRPRDRRMEITALRWRHATR